MADLSKKNDKQLYDLIKNESGKIKEDAFAELYARYSKGIYAYCRRILGSDSLAEDVFQETFLSFLKTTEQQREMTNVQAFLLRIARNICLNTNRERRTKLISLDEFSFGVDDDRYEKSELSKIIVNAVELLSEEQKESVVLQLYYDMSYKEISDFLNLPISTIRNRITRGKQSIREVLAPYFEKDNVK